MENYIVSARKYRPSSFKTVVGQQALTHTLKSAIDSNRLAHAYLFCGPRGVGKTSCARIFAKTINCLSPTHDNDACNECESCMAFNEQRSYNIVELDAASNNSVDDIRTLTEQVRIPPQIGKYKVFIIDEVHMLSTAAFNAFLKTLEEPPAHAIFILATTEKHKILPTILSRCQIYDFSRITIQDIVDQLSYIAGREGISTEPEALNIIAQKADGAMRDALSIFDQVSASSMGNITYKSAIENLNVLDYEYYFKLVETFLNGDVPRSLLLYKEIRDHGFDSLFFINGLASHFRDLMVAANPHTSVLLEASEDVCKRYVEQAHKCSTSFLYKAMDICNYCDINYRTAGNKQFFVELSLIKICQIINDNITTESKETIKKINVKDDSPCDVKTVKNNVVDSSVDSAEKKNELTGQSELKKDAVHQIKHTDYKVKTVHALHDGSNGNNNSGRQMPPRISITGNASSGNVSEDTNVVYGGNGFDNKSFSDEEFINAWQQFITENPKEHILVNTMRMSVPRRLKGEIFQMQVENVGQVDFIHNNLSKLLEFLRSRLSNTNVTLDISVNEDMVAPRFLSPKDIVTEMMGRNEDIKSLIQRFELGLA